MEESKFVPYPSTVDNNVLHAKPGLRAEFEATFTVRARWTLPLCSLELMMSLFKFLFDSDRKRRADINELKDRARRQQILSKSEKIQRKNEVAELESHINDLELQIGELQLSLRALISVMQRRPEWNEAEFADALLKVDLEDGVQDGRVTKSIDE